MTLKYNPMTLAVRRALITGAVLTVGFGPQALAQQDNGEAVEEQSRLVVTGSRIKRSDVEGALPVTVYSREDLELSGESNAADFLRNTTFNSFGSFRPQSGSSQQGVSTLSLRGLGAARTLVLIDGRRLPKSPSTGSSQDLNTLPMGAIERIEVLSDGASAIYGSDAIGGVINIITRSDYEGAEMMIGGAEVSIPANGGEREEGYVLFGANGDRSSIIAGISWNDREIIYQDDLPWKVAGASTFSNNFRAVTATGNETGSYFPVVDGCNFPGTGFYILQSTGRCAYDFDLVAADEASTENKSFFARAKHEVNNDWMVWANAGFYQTESFGRYAPVPDGSVRAAGGPAPLTLDSPNNPSNPLSPVYDPVNFPEPQLVHWRHRFDALGNRDSNVTNQRTNFEVGVTGQIGQAEVEFGMNTSDNRTSDVGRNYLLRSAAFEAIQNGSYNLQDPYNADPSVLNAMRITIFRDGKYDQDEVFGSVSFDVFDMANGPVSAFIGTEYRKEKFADLYDPQSEAGQVGGSSGNSAVGERDVTSVFFEALFPLMDNLEMSLAGRYDDYSDYGNDFSPKLSFRYQPLDNLTLRASFGEGFRAPSLDILNQKPSTSADTITDAQTCQAEGLPDNCRTQVQAIVIANPNLQSEQSEQFAFGLAYEPFDWFNFTIDYYNIEIDNRIRSFTTQFLINRDISGDPVPSGLGCQRDPATGGIIQCTRGFGNEGVIETSGIDFNARFNYAALGGRFSHNLQWSRVLDQSVDGGRNLINDPGAPADRIVVSNQYTLGNWSVGYNLNLIGDQANTVVDGQQQGHVPTWVTHDLQANYHTPWDGRFTLGVRNAGEKFPPLGLGSIGSRQYDFNLYDGYGRVTYFRYTQTF